MPQDATDYSALLEASAPPAQPKPTLTMDEVFGPGGLMAQQLPGYMLRESQLIMAREVATALATGSNLLVEAPTGCHAAGQGILMHDGTTRRVEDVQVDDLLQGPNGPRLVLGLARGRQEMVDIIPVKGRPWQVNLDHILTLIRTDTGQVVDVSVREWWTWSKWMKNIHKLFRAPALFQSNGKDLPLDAYFLGVLLGDGTLSHPCVNITKPDPEIAEMARAEAARWGLEYKFTPPHLHRIVGPIGIKHHPILARLRALGLMPIRSCARFVPQAYKSASFDDRLALLAGLIDTDGSRSNSCYDFISGSPILADDVAFLARSVGLAAYTSSCFKGCNGKEDVYFRVSISGNTDTIPCRIPRKKAPPRQQIKDACRTGFAVKPTGKVEAYFGFTLDGDGRYLLDDFTVTHNTGKSLAYSVPAIQHALATGQRVLIATANIALQEQLVQKDLPFLASILPEPFQFTLLKGRGQFLCRDKHDEHKSQLFAGAVSDEDRDEFERVLAWAGTTSTGDASEIPFKVAPRVWRHFSVADTSECAGCKLLCFHRAAVTEAEDAQIVVCNYHLLFAHLMVRQATAGNAGVVPPFDVLICDEAHEIPDIGSDFAGEQIGRWCFRGFRRHLSQSGFQALDRAAENLARAIQQLSFTHGAQGSGRIKEAGLIDEGPILDALRDALRELKA